MPRKTIASGARWNRVVGSWRAVGVGRVVHVSGTTATDATGRIVGRDDPYAQAVQALRNIGRALEQAGARFADVVRTRMYVTDIAHWEAVGRAPGGGFAHIPPPPAFVGGFGVGFSIP